jgi:four helix bundle protein
VARQLLRSGTSVGANLEEAAGAQSRRDLTSKFSIAFKEARETRYWLRLIAATEPSLTKLLSPVLNESNQLVAILTTSVRRLKQ